jgi:hypothetical protein
MNINDFQNLDRETQLTEAGRIAGVEPSVFDGIWRTESGRGAAMLSPAGAEGHFGLMPKTRATMEQRFGAPIDPYNFGQSLFTAAHLMRENLGRFRNLPDALRAYNGGWDPKRWANPETATYAGKVLGTDEEEGAADLNGSTALALADVHVGVRRDAAEVPLGGEVGGDHPHGLRDHRQADRPGRPQPGAQFVPERDEREDRHGDRLEHGRQSGGEIADDRAAPGGLAQYGGLGLHPAGAVQHEVGEEGVEVGEVPVQDALGAARLRGDRPARESARPVPQQDALGGVEQLLTHVAHGDPGRHRAFRLSR